MSSASLSTVWGAEVSRDVNRLLDEHSRVCVFVELNEESPSASAAGLPKTAAQRRAEYARAQDRFLRAIPKRGCETRYRFRYSPTLTMVVSSKAALEALAAVPGVRRIVPDRRGSHGLNESRTFIGADDVNALGLTGEGKVVAVIDTGIDSDHPDFEGAILDQHHFLDQGTITGSGAEDGHGHGSNVAGIIASRGKVSRPGLAPAASLVIVQVLDNDGRGFISDWVRGAEYVVDLHRANNGIRVDVLNMSLVSDDQYTGECDFDFRAYAAACQAARAEGIAVYACSGNRGSHTQMTSPGCLSTAWSVGSVRDTAPDRISSFTSRNKLLDLLAPGQAITSSGLDGGQSTFQGCSQATPHVSGLACLMLEVDPELAPAEITEVLKSSGVTVFDSATNLEFKRIDAVAAIDAIGGAPAIFLRGDTNDDGAIQLADGVFVLNHLFAGGAAPSCVEAADTNNDGSLNLADGVFVLNYLFGGGAPPPDPGPLACGSDPDEPGTPGDLGCEGYLSCAL